LVANRPAVSIDDLRKVAKPALRHRVLSNFEADADGVEADAIIENIVQTLPAEAGSVAAG
ncbi:MAG: AAA family ATPase, partial [Planctomycetota bacterium]